jgi:hypothetical protein
MTISNDELPQAYRELTRDELLKERNDALAQLAALTAANTRLEQERDEAQRVMEFHPRATKLIQKGKPFIVIAIDEPYFQAAYDLIRRQEKENGTWTDDDEISYFEMLSEHIAALARGQEGK